MLLAAFRNRYGEFKAITDGPVQACLDEAAARISADAFGTRFDIAHGWLAAHLLWESPSGSSMRLDGNGDEKVKSPYLRGFEAVRRENVVPMLVT